MIRASARCLKPASGLLALWCAAPAFAWRSFFSPRAHRAASEQGSGGRPVRFAAMWALCASLVLMGADAAAAQDSRRLVEQDIKAGLLYNFLRYTQWPPGVQTGATIDVCLYGRDPFEGRLQPMAGRSVNQRVIAVRTVRTSAEMSSCALVFINAEERAAWPRLRAELGVRSVLTVSDYEGFARSGGMLEFTRARNRVGVMVNVGAAHAANLEVQDRLLRLATVVSSANP
jgi:hypothetical protein